ncbi:MAG: VWA domain-containing protein [Planctomycetes bacterium]|nr:VWA domain-containing protein [Planctomycetota bacterium]
MPAMISQLVPFVHPAIAGIALATGLIPILVHLINRRRYRRVPWAAMSFLMAAHRRSARRVRLEQWLVLVMRIAVVVLFGLAVARPYFPASALSPLVSTRSHRVLVIDNSLSMSARTQGGATRFDLAKLGAQRLLDSFPRNDAVSIVTLARPAEALIAHPAYDRRFVREQLTAIRPTQREADVVGALAAAAEIIRASDAPPKNRSVYLLSDLPRREWLPTTAKTSAPTALEPTAGAAITALRALADTLENPALDLNIFALASGSQAAAPPTASAAHNVAVTDLLCVSPLVSLGQPARLSVEVSNFGPISVGGLSLQIRRDGEIIRTSDLPSIEPGGSTLATISTAFATPGTHILEARVSGMTEDALVEDNARFLSLEVRDTIPVLLVDGRPSSSLLGGQTGYLATALAPDALRGAERSARFGSRSWRTRPKSTGESARVGSRTLWTPKVISDSELDGEAFAEYDVIALCNVQRLSAQNWNRLGQFVRRGGGLFIFAGDLLSIDNYNQYGYAQGSGLLPGKFLPQRGGVELSDDDESTSLSPDDLIHPIAAGFAEHPSSGLFLAQIDRTLPIEPDPARAEIVWRYRNGEAALVEAGYGKGRVLVCTTTAGMDWNNLPAKGDYVSLMVDSFSYLSPRHGDHRNVRVGQSIREQLTPLESSLPLRVTTADGATIEGRLVPVADALALEYGPVGRAGVITATIGSDVRRFVANVDSGESDLRAVETKALATALDRPARFFHGALGGIDLPVASRAGELASPIFYMVIVLLLGEMWMAFWFGSRRSVG